MALGDEAGHRGGVEDVVVEREVAHREHVDPGLPAGVEVRRAQAAGDRLDLGRRGATGPMGLQRGLELPLGSDAGKAQHGGACHLSISCAGGSDRGATIVGTAGKPPAASRQVFGLGCIGGRPPSQAGWPSGSVAGSASLPLRVSSGL